MYLSLNKALIKNYTQKIMGCKVVVFYTDYSSKKLLLTNNFHAVP